MPITINFFILFLLCAIMCIVLTALLKNTRLKKLLLMLFGIFAVLTVSEKYFDGSYEQTKATIRYDRELAERLMGFSPETNTVTTLTRYTWLSRKNNQAVWSVGEHPKDVEIVHTEIFSISPYGFRYMPEVAGADSCYVFLGCSNIFGHGVGNNETLPYYFLENINRTAEVLNCGVGGKGINCALSIINNGVIENISNNKEVKHIFFSIMRDTYQRSFRFQDPSDAAIFSNGNITYQPQPLKLLKMFFTSSGIYNRFIKPYVDAHYNKLYQTLFLDKLKQMQSLAKSKYNTRFTVIIWPIESDLYFYEQLKNFLLTNNIDFIDLTQTLGELDTWEIPLDGHPTPETHKTVANILFEHIRQKQDKAIP